MAPKIKSVFSIFFFIVTSIFCFAQNYKRVTVVGNYKRLCNSFEWAKNKTIFFAHYAKDLFRFWYEVAFPNREGFCMRNVSNQAIGAQVLRLSQYNFNLFLIFAQNISTVKDYCFWEIINRYNKPTPLDFVKNSGFLNQFGPPFLCKAEVVNPGETVKVANHE